MKTTLGGDRLGSGGKQEISMKNYGRSTHDLSYIWRSSMSSGTLVPFMSELSLPGDSFDIDLDCSVLTLPTVGPLFGSYKVQLDVFTVPIRLYNAKLHMNKLGIGLDMSKITLPLMELTAFWKDGAVTDNDQINASSIFSYLNVRGLGRGFAQNTQIQRAFNAVPYLGYWDIYKQYYANKQEEDGVMIHVSPGVSNDYAIFSADSIHKDNGTRKSIMNAPQTVNMGWTNIEITLYDGEGNPDWDSVAITFDSGDFTTEDKILSEIYDTKTVNGLTCIWSNYNVPNPVTSNVRVQAQSIPSDSDPNDASTPQLVRFPLSNIDDLRDDIYAAVKNTSPFSLSNLSQAPYGLPLTFNDTLEITAAQYNQEGLAIKTYQSDLFNNWITTEWIDGANGINEITSVDTTGDSFTIDALNLANKVYNMLNRIAISGGTYDDWLDAVYTHERTKSVENPVYCGSLIKELAFEEVVSTADSNQTQTGQPLGTLAGRGQLTRKNKGGKIKIKTDEPSYILGIVSLTPRVDYSQGNKWDMNLKTLDDLHKPALDAIGYQDLVTDQLAWFDTGGITADPADTPNYQSAGKQPAWINYMTNVNQVRGNFAERNNQMFMTLNRRYEIGQQGIEDLTTYIDPSKFNHIFADARLDAQNFWVQISNKITARRKMSAKIIPNL